MRNNNIVSIVSIVTIALWLAVGEVQANNYPVNRHPVVSDQGQKMGTAVVERRGDDIHVDFDFDAPYDCKLTEVRYDIQNNQDRFPRDDRGALRSNGFRYRQTYDKVRDAQIVLDLPNRNSHEDVYLSTRLSFECDGGRQVRAAVEEEGNSRHYVRYRSQQPAHNRNNQWYDGYWRDHTQVRERYDDRVRTRDWYPGYWEDYGSRANRSSVVLGYGNGAQFTGPVNNPNEVTQYRWDNRLGRWISERVPFRR